MASHGWQGQQYLYTPMSGYDYYVDLWVDTITHSGTNLRVTGQVALKNVGSSSSWYNWWQPVYADIQNSGGSTLQSNVVIRESNQSMAGGTYSSGSFDVTITGVSESTTSYTLKVYTHEVNNILNKTFSWTLSFDASGSPPSSGYVEGLWSTYENNAIAVRATRVGVSTSLALTDLAFNVSEQPYISGRPRQEIRGFSNGGSVLLTQANSAAQAGGITIQYNHLYHTGIYSSNSAGAYRYQGPTFVTPPAPATFSVVSVDKRSVTIAYTTTADAGYDIVSVQYNYTGTEPWHNMAVINDSTTSHSGTFTITGLEPDTTYTIGVRTAIANAGVTQSADLTATTLKAVKLYGSVNGDSEEIIKLYGSVGGESKAIKKLYGSVNGRAKLIYKEN